MDVWVPLATYPHYRSQIAGEGSPAGPDVFLLGRLASGRSLAQATAEFQLIDSRLRQAEPRSPRFRNPAIVHPVAGYNWAEARRGLQPMATLLLAAVGIVLLIACVNVANLLLSRGAARQRELSVRRALGASRAQLVRQGITEGLVLAAGGSALGVVLGFWVNRGITAFLPSAHPDLSLYTFYLDVNWRVAGFTAITAVICALVFSVSPALDNSRGDVNVFLKGAAAGSARRRGWRSRDYFVVAQVALSLVLLVCAGLLIRALWEAKGTDPGFSTDNRAYLRLFTPDNDFTPQQATTLYSRLLDEARELPGVQDVTLSFAVFGFMDGDCAAASQSDPPRKLNINVVEPNYFDFMNVPLLRGRSFVSGDRSGAPRVIVVNETMARRWWPGADALGKTAWLGCDTDTRVPAEVVGVVRDSKYGSLDEQPRPFYFVHWRQVWWNGFFALMLHTAGDPHAVAEPLLGLARTGGANLRIYEFRSFNDMLGLSLFRIKWQATLLTFFGLLAIALATVGLYGLVAYVATQGTREIGIHMALGAQSSAVRWMVLGHGLRLTLIGVLLGLFLSAGAAQLLRGFLFGISPLDPAAFAVAALIWILISTWAGYGPARRATLIDPVAALRHE